jgi:hypothetical protein
MEEDALYHPFLKTLTFISDREWIPGKWNSRLYLLASHH